MGGRSEIKKLMVWQEELTKVNGYDPVVVGGLIRCPDPMYPDKQMVVDSMGIVTLHDGLPLPPGEIIAPAVGTDSSDPDYHNNYQDPEAFLRAGGRRGRQYIPLTDGTYFINRWLATVEMIPKTVVPIGFVGVVVSYYGERGRDVSGEKFRHGELVGEGEVGVRKRPLGPGKYPFNTYAGQINLVPTTNFVLHWVTGRTEEHLYDESLRSIEVVTLDAFEPVLPLSVVLHIDYEKAPSVIQRFGDVKKLITQTLDPLLSAYFRDIAHRKTMLQLLQERDDIQDEGRAELRKRFLEFDIECVDVLIGKPDTAAEEGKIETLLEQLRLRQLSIEQLETYERRRAASVKLRELHEAEAAVLLRKISSYVDPRLYAMSIVAEHLSGSAQPLVPERLFVAGGEGGEGGAGTLSQGIVGLLISLLVAEKSGFELGATKDLDTFKDLADRMSREAMESLQKPDEEPVPAAEPEPSREATEPTPAAPETPPPQGMPRAEPPEAEPVPPAILVLGEDEDGEPAEQEPGPPES